MIKNIALGLASLGFLATASMALAQTASTTTSVTTTSAAVPHMVLQIGPAGRALLRGTVTSVSATSITVQSWGGVWTINVPTTAKVMPQGVALASFKAGDFVGVQGTVDSSAAWTINATLVRDWTARQALTQEIKTNVQSVHQILSSGSKTVQGTLSNLDATAKTFTLTSSGGTAYAVTLSSGALLLTQNRATLDLTQVHSGDTVRVYGSVSSSTISASIFRDVSVK